MKKLLFSLLLINTFFFTVYAQNQLKEKNISYFNPSATFIVNNDGDTNDANTSDNLCADTSGNCTLRAAIQQANASAGDDTISFALATPATINLTLGELSITSNLTISGLGARNLIVQRSTAEGTTNFRIFNLNGMVGMVVNISGITISNGFSDFPNQERGGGILNASGAILTLDYVSVINNRAGLGAGIANLNGTLNVSNSTISNNIGTSSIGNPTSGGGINNNLSGIANISNSTISDNSATQAGGILHRGSLQLTNVTIANNTAFSDNPNHFVIGGGIFGTFDTTGASGTPTRLRNTIIANNTSFMNPDVYGIFDTLGNNLIGINNGAESSFPSGNPNSNNDKVGTSANPIDPLLGALQDNGGQTDTRALLMGSPAIDMGNNCVVTATCPSSNPPEPLTTDQRGAGFLRLIDGNNDAVAVVDIGAFEFIAITAANVAIGGRVLNPKGQGVFRAIVTLTNQHGEIKYAVTNPFGYYRFENVSAGETYILNVAHKRYSFTPQAYFADSENFDLNFTANPQRVEKRF